MWRVVSMKNKLHGLCIRFGWYREVFTGHYDIGRTIIGTHFIIGDYLPISLQRCIDLEVMYDAHERDHYLKESPSATHFQESLPASKLLAGAAAVGIAAMTPACDDRAENQEALKNDAPTRIDPPHS